MSDTPLYARVVVGTDGSQTANRAVQRAAAIASATGADLLVATSWYREMDEPVPSELVKIPGQSLAAMEARWAEMTVADAAGVARTTGARKVVTRTPQGGPAETLLDLASSTPNSLLVVGTVGLGSRTQRLMGNVPHQVSHHAEGDVLLVHSTSPIEGDYRSVALATDGSRTAAIAVERGLKLSRALGAEAVLLTACHNEAAGNKALDKAIARLGDGHDLERVLVKAAHVADAIVQVGQKYDLLVIGNKGMSGPSRLLGSVANEITHGVPTDLLLVNTTGRG